MNPPTPRFASTYRTKLVLTGFSTNQKLSTILSQHCPMRQHGLEQNNVEIKNPVFVDDMSGMGGVDEIESMGRKMNVLEEDGFAVLLGTAGGCSCGLNTFK